MHFDGYHKPGMYVAGGKKSDSKVPSKNTLPLLRGKSARDGRHSGERTAAGADLPSISDVSLARVAPRFTGDRKSRSVYEAVINSFFRGIRGETM